jgi:anti-sigma B factor antagonist
MGARWSVDVAADGCARVAVDGELDLVAEQALVDDVAATLGAAACREVRVDLHAVEFIDSSGVRALVRMRRAHGDRVRFESVSSPVRKVLDIAGLTDHLGIERRDDG